MSHILAQINSMKTANFFPNWRNQRCFHFFNLLARELLTMKTRKTGNLTSNTQEYTMEAATHIETTTERNLFDTLKDLNVANHERLLRGIMYITGIRQIDIARKYNIDNSIT